MDRRLVVVLALALATVALAACGTSPPSQSASDVASSSTSPSATTTVGVATTAPTATTSVDVPEDGITITPASGPPGMVISIQYAPFPTACSGTTWMYPASPSPVGDQVDRVGPDGPVAPGTTKTLTVPLSAPPGSWYVRWTCRAGAAAPRGGIPVVADRIAELAVVTPDPADTPGLADALALVGAVYRPYAGATVSTPLLSACFSPGSDRCPRPLSEVMTDELAARLAAARQDRDPIVCAQNFPVDVSYAPLNVVDQSASVIVRLTWGGHAPTAIVVTVDMTRGRLTDLVCLDG